MSEKKPYDPVLRQAMEDIKNICKKHNIGAHVLLASPTHTEFGLLYDLPSWSCASFQTLPNGSAAFRMKARGGNARDHRKVDATIHMIFSFADIMMNHVHMIRHNIVPEIEKYVQVEARPLGQVPDSHPGDGL